MKIERRDGADTRRVLIGMIVDEHVLARITSKWEPGGLFADTWSNLIGGWCVGYFEKYRKAPNGDVESLFDEWSGTQPDKATVKLVQRFLEGLSGDYEELASDSNSDYVIDLAGRLFKQVRLARLKESLDASLEAGDIAKAEQRVNRFSLPDLGAGSSIDPFHDREAIRAAFAESQEPLITYPGALGQLMSDRLARDCLFAYLGAEKKGKTYWLLDLAWRGLMNRHKVAFFQVGDLSQNQIMRRFMCRAAARPLQATSPKRPINYPLAIERKKGQAQANVETEPREFAKALSWKTAVAACDRIITSKLKTHDPLLRLSVHVAGSIGVAGVRSTLQAWDREGWSPDIVVLDYADILAAPPGIKEGRDQINENWRQLRALSQELHCLVATATQADAASYVQHLLTRKNFSNDKRILAHCTDMIGLNQIPSEKAEGVYRLNWIVRREGEYSETRCVHVASCLALANPAVRSCW